MVLGVEVGLVVEEKAEHQRCRMQKDRRPADHRKKLFGYGESAQSRTKLYQVSSSSMTLAGIIYISLPDHVTVEVNETLTLGDSTAGRKCKGSLLTQPEIMRSGHVSGQRESTLATRIRGHSDTE